MNITPYHKSLSSLHIGCEEPRAYYIPYGSEISALENKRENSKFYTNLNGEWNFKFYKSFEDVDDDFLSRNSEDKISVPSCWQLDLDKGYDVPLYSNLWYPFPIDPPFVPADNPCGHYSRNFEIAKKENKRYYINFEGVSSGFYLFINNIFKGYSQVSHCISEFDITDLLNGGSNKIDVLCVKWCTGSYLEDQDMFRLSGIFRDVYILERSPKSIKDIYIKRFFNDNLDEAKIKIETNIIPEYSLYDPKGNLIDKNTGYELSINSPALWSSESPNLYTLILKFDDEYIPFPLALCKTEIRGNVAYFNNKPIKLLGINRHDSNPKTGYYTDYEHMKNDLMLLKRANVNTIRTSHYPNSPLFIELCEKYGFMLVNEADIETHGMGFEYKDTWDWFRWSKLSTDDEWEESYVDRAKRLFERDKNHGCIIMWSLGNESGAGKNHRAMRKYIKSRDNNAIVHYENSHLEFKAVPEGENFSDISDVESRMYSSLEYTEEYAKNKNSKKPFFFCEFACSMSTGDIHAHADLIRKYPTIFGGCFWELTDHAVDIGNKKYRYGGDFGDFPNNSVCCIDGIVFPDRSLRPGYDDLKKAYEPFECAFKNNILTVKNRRYFTSLDDMYLRAEIEIDGNVISSQIFSCDIAPQGTKEYKISFDIQKSDCAFLNVYLCQKNKTEWAEKDYICGLVQFDISSCEIKAETHPNNLPEYKNEGRYITINSKGIIYTFDKPYGRIISCIFDGKEMLSAPITTEIWKAPGYNEIDRAKDLRSAAMESAITNVRNCEIFEKSDHLEIVCHAVIGGPAVVPVLEGNFIYKFYSDGTVNIGFDGEIRDLLKEMNLRLPRFGFCVSMPKEFNKMVYFGKGPNEAYADRHKAQRYGKFKTDTRSNFVPYIKPIENGAHFGTRWAKVTNGNTGFEFKPVSEKAFLFNASHFTPHQLEECKHNDELIENDKTFVYLDYKMDIRGGRGVYEDLEPERKWNFGKIFFEISMKPIVNFD